MISPPSTMSRRLRNTSLTSQLSSIPSELQEQVTQLRLAELLELRSSPLWGLLLQQMEDDLTQSQRLAQAATEPVVAFRHTREAAAIKRSAIEFLNRLIEVYQTQPSGESHNA